MNATHDCPICSTKVGHWERYPNQVCDACYSRAFDENGRLLLFGNVSLFGGFLAFYADTNEKYGSHLCYIDGVKCRADEHRFGGIVIETVH